MSETDDDEKEEADATEEACISLGSVDSSGASAAGWYRGSRRSEKAGAEPRLKHDARKRLTLCLGRCLALGPGSERERQLL